MQINELLSRFHNVKQTGPRQCLACCPAHADQHASLSIGMGNDDKNLLHCQAGCTTTDVGKAAGLELKDLFDDVARAAPAEPRPAPRPKAWYPSIEAVVEDTAKRIGGTVAGSWAYPGNKLVVARFNMPDGSKSFRPFHCNGSGWKAGDPPGPLPLYHGDDLSAGNIVFITEGEKCCDTARSVGLTAITSTHGAKSAGKSDWSILAGHEVVILPDNDAAGELYAAEVARILISLNPPAKVKIVRLPGLDDGGDIVNWIDADGPAGGQTAEEIKSRIMALAEAATYWKSTISPGEAEPVIVRLADVKARPIDWLWPGRIARGKLCLICGNPGQGKSFLSLDIASRVSTGKGWPDLPDRSFEPGGVVLLSAEDALDDIVRPRLDAAGADVTRINALTTTRRIDPISGKEYFEPFNLVEHLHLLEISIRQTPDCQLVVIDPLTCFLGRTDSYVASEVRALLYPLSELAERKNVAIVAINHLRKTSEGPAIFKSLGSIAFIAACRTAFVVCKDGEAKDDGHRRLFLPAKSNISADISGLAFELTRADLSPTGIPGIRWFADPVTVSADDALSDRRPAESPELNDAKAWLADALVSGPRAAAEILAKARLDGISKRTLDRAKRDLEVIAHKSGFENGWFWKLPEECREAHI